MSRSFILCSFLFIVVGLSFSPQAKQTKISPFSLNNLQCQRTVANSEFSVRNVIYLFIFTVLLNVECKIVVWIMIIAVQWTSFDVPGSRKTREIVNIANLVQWWRILWNHFLWRWKCEKCKKQKMPWKMLKLFKM